MFIEIDNKSPVKIVYPTEGTPFVTAPSAVFAQAPHPNAARLFENFIFTAKVQQLIVDKGGTRSVHPDVKEPSNRTPLAQIKLLPDDPIGMLPQIAEIKKRYAALFGN
jgi:iron(III) transport system substrate-binding protein